MDHETAVQLQASERYVLGDLPAAERNEFEDHLADCSRCMRDLALADVFAANATAVFQDEATGKVAERRGWFDFLRPWATQTLAFSGALNLILAVAAGYSVLHVVPSFESRLRQFERPGISETFVVRPQTRGASQVYTAPRSRPFAVFNFDLPQHYQRYAYSLTPSSQTSPRSSSDLAVAANADTLQLTVPTASLPAGDYTLALTGSNGPSPEEIVRCVVRIQPEK